MQKSKRMKLILGSTIIAFSVMLLLVFGVKAGVPRFSQNQAAGVQLVCQDAAIPYTFCFDDETCSDILAGVSDQSYITYPFTPTLDGKEIGPTVTAAFVRQQETYNFTTNEETKTNYYDVRLQPFVESLEAGEVVKIDTGEEDGGGERIEFTEPVGSCFLRQIDVQLTVSTDEAECGTTSAVDIPHGSDAYFCVEVTNNTIVSQTRTTISIPALGLEGESSQTLLPGQSVVFTSADFPELGPVAINADVDAHASVQSFNRTLVFGVDVTSADEPFETIADTDSAKITAVAPETHALTVNIVGNGSVTPGSGDFTAGEIVELTATPDEGWQFDGWGGALDGTANPASVTMGADKTVVATFTEVAPQTHALTINIVGNGSVTPGSGDFTAGEIVELTATPDEGWQFDGWGGALDGTANPASVTMEADKTVVATFTEFISTGIYLPIVVAP